MEKETAPQKSSSGKWFFIFGALILFGILTFALFNRNAVEPSVPETKTTTTIQSSCEQNGGTYLAEYNECEYIDEQTCIELGGAFNECGSACRHEEGPVACTMNCVPFCAF